MFLVKLLRVRLYKVKLSLRSAPVLVHHYWNTSTRTPVQVNQYQHTTTETLVPLCQYHNTCTITPVPLQQYHYTSASIPVPLCQKQYTKANFKAVKSLIMVCQSTFTNRDPFDLFYTSSRCSWTSFHVPGMEMTRSKKMFLISQI